MSSTSPARRAARRAPLLATAVAVAGLVAASLPAAGQAPAPPLWEDYGFQGEGDARVDSVDRREGRLAPTAAQRAAAARLGAPDVRWNAHGTPHVLFNTNGFLSGPRPGKAVDVARAFVRENAGLFRLTPAAIDDLEVLRDSALYDAPDLGRVHREGKPPKNPRVAHSVLFGQTFGELDAAVDGLLTVGVQPDGRVTWVSSSVTGEREVAGEQRLGPTQAIEAGARDVDMDLGELSEVPTPDDPFLTFRSKGLQDVQRARLVALPTPADGLRRAWEVTLLDSALDEHGNPRAFISFVDAETGEVWQRSNQVEHFAGGEMAAPVGTQSNDGLLKLPTWRVFPANPPFVTDRNRTDDNKDTRVLWCWDDDTNPDKCAEEQFNDASRLPWDVNAPSLPSFTTDGNNATTAISEVNFRAADTAFNRPFSATRDYDFPWRNRWFQSSCNPTNFGTVVDDRNDEAAATTNLFVQHNRMHDWSYFLGFTEENFNMQKSNFGNTGPDRENDPELGQSQAGRRTINGRDNANQATLQDGIAPITNQYLWQPLAGAFYSPCVDGAYDQAVVAHEYTHAITNRMLGGPNGGTGPSQGQTESWSDLGFAAYFQEFGIAAGAGVNPFVLGPYVTGDPLSGIRNHAMNQSPLNYTDLDYDGNGLGSPHANGEIWSAVNFDIARSLAAKYDDGFPARDKRLQVRCARGELAATSCPGNRRWNQIQFDSFLLQPTGVSMIDSRDAMLAADRMRFGGANQRELWDVFARRGLGKSAKTAGPQDVEAIGGFDSPLRADEAQVTFRGPAGSKRIEVFAGIYEARATPVADNDPETDEIGTRMAFVPGTYTFVARGDGFGMRRFTETFRAGEKRTVTVPLRRNLASKAAGAKATGDGVNLDKLIDDSEETNWASLTSDGTASKGKGEGAQVEGRQVTIDLAGREPVRVTDIQVSAALRGPVTDTDQNLPSDPDPGTQSRFSALRSFDVLACNSASGADCSKATSFRKIFSSRDDAFPSRRPRPKVPDLILRSFDVRDTMATHLRMVVRDNQCTGAPDFQGATNPDSDPVFNPDCDTMASSPDRQVLRPPFNQVRAAEFQVFGR